LRRHHILGAALLFGLFCLPGLAAFAASQPETLTVNRIVAVVNGEMISQFDLEMASTPDLMQARIDPRNPANADKVQEVMRGTLEKMITDIIVVQEAERMHISAPERDVTAELEGMAKRARLEVPELLEQLDKQGMKEDMVRDRLRKRILQQRLLANMVGRKVIVSQDEVAKEFASMGGVYTLPGQIAFAVLIYPPNMDAAAASKDIAAGKISFEEAVKRVSMGPRRAQGGKLDAMPENDVAPPLRAAMEGVAVGGITKVFDYEGMKTQLKVLERIDGKRLTSLEEAAPYVEEKLREPRLQQRYKDYLDQLRKKALVEIRL